jgi:hypothetical protein
MLPISTERTLGHSPKVVWPGLAATAFGAGLLLIGRAVAGRALEAAGIGALAASALATLLGYHAPPGVVVAPDFDVHDVHEHDQEPVVASFAPARERTVG